MGRVAINNFVGNRIMGIDTDVLVSAGIDYTEDLNDAFELAEEVGLFTFAEYDLWQFQDMWRISDTNGISKPLVKHKELAMAITLASVKHWNKNREEK